MQIQFSRLRLRVSLFSIAVLVCGISFAQGQDATGSRRKTDASPKSATLTIGSKAPSLDIEHWIHDGNGQFKHVSDFEKNKVYLVEFWATWCVPCIQAMPHVVALQKEHAKDGFQVIAISDESLKEIDDFLDQTVRGSEDEDETYRELTSSYCLVSDPDGSTGRDYMRASKQRGIPCAFLVGKSGVIEWIGHPMSVDQAIQQVLDDSWDRDAFLEEYLEEQRSEALMVQMQTLMQQGKTDEALKRINQAISSAKSAAGKNRFRAVKFQILASSRALGKELAAYIKSTLADETLDPQMANMIGWNVYKMRTVKRIDDASVIEASIEHLSSAAERAEDNQASIWDTVAHLQEVHGDLPGALKSQKKAVQLASPSEKETLVEYLEQLQASASKK